MHFSILNGKLRFSRDLQGPTWGYPTEGAYYRDASSCDSLLAVRIPLFAIHAEDDPVCSQLVIPVSLPHIFIDSRHGGTPFTGIRTESICGFMYYLARRTPQLVRNGRREMVCQACKRWMGNIDT